MKNIKISKIIDIKDIDILLNRSSSFGDSTYKYNLDDINYLKTNFKRRDSLYLIAKNGNDFAAFCSIDSEWWGKDSFFIREIFISPSFQKQKIGEKIMGQCIKHAKENDAIYVVTETAFQNIPMQKLCNKLGFVEWDNPEWKEGITYKLEL